MTPSPSSRLVQQEQKKAVKQTFLFLILSVVILLVFLVFGLPLFFDFFVKMFGGSTTTQDSQFPPQVPAISAPVSATSSAQLKLSGYTEAKAEVIIVRNSEQVDTVTADDTGNFNAEIQLQEGENTLNAFARRGDKESENSISYKVKLDTKKPLLEVAEPADNQSFESRSNQSITIKGKTDPDAKILLNNRTVYPNDKGEFETKHQLQEGDNELTIVAVDEAQNKTEMKRKVKFKL